jgi:hypothetical protein
MASHKSQRVGLRDERQKRRNQMTYIWMLFCHRQFPLGAAADACA